MQYIFVINIAKYLMIGNKIYLYLVGLVWFYGISTIVGYSMPNLFLYT